MEEVLEVTKAPVVLAPEAKGQGLAALVVQVKYFAVEVEEAEERLQVTEQVRYVHYRKHCVQLALLRIALWNLATSLN